MSTLVLVHAAATWFMVGLIWVIQVVHYPLFAAVGPAGFADYERGHTVRIGRLLAVPAVVEVTTAAALAVWRPTGVPLWLVLASGLVLTGLWVVTVAVQVPLHTRLGDAFDRSAIDALVASNWWRTAGWSVRGILAIIMIGLAG